MKYLEFEVSNMAISRKQGDKAQLISGAVNYFGLNFSFDEEFSEIPGIKSVEMSKNRQMHRVDLVEGKCAIPNELLRDKNPIEFRVVCGNTIATPWVSINITESGSIMPEVPEEDTPAGTEYVKTLSGESAAPYLRANANGLEYSKDGETWQGGISGVPDVPKKPVDKKYVRVNGDWVPADELLLSGTATQITALDYSETDIPTIVSKINDVILLLQTRGVATV